MDDFQYFMKNERVYNHQLTKKDLQWLRFRLLDVRARLKLEGKNN